MDSSIDEAGPSRLAGSALDRKRVSPPGSVASTTVTERGLMR